MSTNFLIQKEPMSWLGAAVFAVGAVSPLDMLDDIERGLRKREVTGRVCFDLLLAHGNKINRYFWGEFDGRHFKKNRFHAVQENYDELSAVSAEFLKDHVAEVDVSLLSNAMRYAVVHGIPL